MADLGKLSLVILIEVGATVSIYDDGELVSEELQYDVTLEEYTYELTASEGL